MSPANSFNLRRSVSVEGSCSEVLDWPYLLIISSPANESAFRIIPILYSIIRKNLLESSSHNLLWFLYLASKITLYLGFSGTVLFQLIWVLWKHFIYHLLNFSRIYYLLYWNVSETHLFDLKNVPLILIYIQHLCLIQSLKLHPTQTFKRVRKLNSR